MSDSIALVDPRIELSEEMIAAVAAVLLTYDEPAAELSTRRVVAPYIRFRNPRGWR
ncbi:hypothetical protein ACFWPK_30935 [Nocardia sp. NPDC058519]|uniref:hypothetical protein n=1 Tax=Nocardia sp. NPDC058519 TaxID=3346535 RepID=UPI00365AE79D